MSYKQIISDIESKKFSNIYLLHGEESYYIDRISDAIIKHALEDHERDFNQSILYGKEITVGNIIDEAQQFPMMAERRLVVVREAQNLKKSISELAKYAEHPTSTTILVICYKYDNIDGRSSLVSKCSKTQTVFKSEKIRDYQLVDYVTSLVQENGYQITNKAAMLFAESVGTDLSRIFTELTKLSVLIEKGQQINEVHIEENIGISKDYNIFELTKAVGLRDVPKAIRIVDYFEKNPKNASLVMITGNLFGLFSKLMRMHFWKDSDQALMKSIRISHPFILKEHRNYQKIYPPKKISANIGYLHEYDLKSKGVNNKDFTEMQLARELIFKLMH
ncbi:MAG: DNA polymerase III subunit delta [Bacteroidetes bacterium]|nr:DNA polymerase III subunit delta [Bacteroidota bacterium]